MAMDVNGELLTEGQFDEGLILAAPKERERATQHDDDEREQRTDHGRIVRGAGLEWVSQSRAVAHLFSMDEEAPQLGKLQQNQRGRILGTDRGRSSETTRGLASSSSGSRFASIHRTISDATSAFPSAV